MNLIDLRTLMMITLIICSVCTLLVTILWRQNKERFSGMHLWVLSFVLQTLGVLLIMLRGVASDWLSIVAANVSIVCAAVLLNIGLEEFLNKKGPRIQYYLLIGVFTIICVYYTYAQPNISARIINFSIMLLLVSLQGMWLVFCRVKNILKPVTRGIGLVLALFGLLNLIRIIKVLTVPEMNTGYFHLGVFQTFMHVFYMMILILEIYSLSLMINKKLVFEIKAEEDKFSRAFHTSPYGIVIARLTGGVIVEVNDMFLKMTGYTREEMIGKSSYDLHIWYDEDECGEMVGNMMKEGRLCDKEMPLRKKNGDIFCGLVSSDMLVIDQTHCILSSILDITERKQQQFEREALIEQLQQALGEVKTLSGMLPICSSCKKIRDDKGYWNSIEAYIHKHSAAKFTHGICPDCRKKLYPEYAESKKS